MKRYMQFPLINVQQPVLLAQACVLESTAAYCARSEGQLHRSLDGQAPADPNPVAHA